MSELLPSALVLFSGGQDSTTCLAWALSRFERVETVGFDYGQRHRIELECRETVRAGLGYALLPLYLIEQELAAGTLRVALDAPYSTDMAYYIVTPEGRADSAAGFRDWLIGQVSFRPLARGV